MSEKVVETLKAARAKVEAGWTQRSAARDADGLQCGWADASACSFCAMGALWRVATKAHLSEATDILERALDGAGAGPGMSVISFNDSPYRLKEDVLKLYDVAIEIAGRET
jgi:hypothetical protein